MNIIEKIKKLNLPEGQFVVMGSAILEVRGIRKAGDIDIIVTPDLFEKLKNDSKWEYKIEWGELSRTDVECLNNHNGVTLYKYIWGGGEIDFFLNDPERIEKVEDIIFVSLKNLLEVKSSSWNREKDKKDVGLIKEYLARAK